MPQIDPITRISAKDMTDDELRALVEARRERRFKIVENIKKLRRGINVKDEYTKAFRAYVKTLQKFEAKLATIDTDLERLEKYMIDVTAKRMELADFTGQHQLPMFIDTDKPKDQEQE